VAGVVLLVVGGALVGFGLVLTGAGAGRVVGAVLVRTGLRVAVRVLVLGFGAADFGLGRTRWTGLPVAVGVLEAVAAGVLVVVARALSRCSVSPAASAVVAPTATRLAAATATVTVLTSRSPRSRSFGFTEGIRENIGVPG